jgi:hypothetical protein
MNKMKLYGDLLRVLSLNDETKLLFIKANVQTKLCVKYDYLLQIFDHFVDYLTFEKSSFKKYFFKIKKYNYDTNIPNRITHLKFGNYTSYPIMKLPSKLKVLIMNKHRSNDFKIKLPNSLTHLYLSNYEIELPNSLRYLKIEENYKEEFDELLQGLISLEFGYCYYKNRLELPKLKYGLPKSLKFLSFKSDKYSNQNNLVLPQNLIYLRLGKFINGEEFNLPKSLKYLDCYDHRDFKYEDSNGYLLKFHTNLKYINFRSDVDFNINGLPKNITHLKIKNIKKFVEINYPKYLKSLIINTNEE